jgi:hypothetical protein
MKRNIEINGLGPTPSEGSVDAQSEKAQIAHDHLGRVRVNEGDAWYACYNVVLSI